MDLSDAGLLVAAVFAVTTLFDKAIPQLSGWKLQLAAFVIGVGSTFLVAYSTYAHTVTIGGHTLDNVNTAGLILIGLMVTGGATVVDRTFGAIKNVGQNQDA